MRRQNLVTFPCILCLAFISAAMIDLAHSRNKNGMTLAMLRKSEEIGRLRRGFQTSSLATARGFGKRSSQSYEYVPFIGLESDGFSPNQKLENGKVYQYRDLAEKLSTNKDERFSIDFIAEMIRADKGLAKALVERFLDTNGDQLISLEELTHME